jgi:muconolactone D-isomerase
MLYCVQMEVHVPHDIDATYFERLKAKEKERALELQREGKWLHLWRVAGRYANISIFDVDNHDELHNIVSTLPLFPLMQITVTPLSTHPSALETKNGHAV